MDEEYNNFCEWLTGFKNSYKERYGVSFNGKPPADADTIEIRKPEDVSKLIDTDCRTC